MKTLTISTRTSPQTLALLLEYAQSHTQIKTKSALLDWSLETLAFIIEKQTDFRKRTSPIEALSILKSLEVHVDVDRLERELLVDEALPTIQVEQPDETALLDEVKSLFDLEELGQKEELEQKEEEKRGEKE